MTLPRFFAPDAGATGHVVALPADEAAHLTRVLRLKPGDPIRVFDGRGHEWQAAVSEIARPRVLVRLGDSVTPAAEARTLITLAIAVLKGEKMDHVVRDAIMLGVRRLIPLITERTELSAALLLKSGRISRWERIAVSSVKQCGRAVIPSITTASTLSHALAEAESSALQVMLVEPGAAKARALGDVPASTNLTLFIGPEGGWGEGELREASAAGAVLTTLGTQTLRADAVPLVAITAFRALWGDL